MTKPVSFRSYRGPMDPRWFGAKGDGRTDDTKSIVAAIQSSYETCRIVEFETGSYLVTEPLTSGGASDPQNGITLRGKGRSGTYSPQSRYDDGSRAGGAVLVYGGSSGDSAILDIRNSDTGLVENLGFDGFAIADHCVRMTHVEGDARSPYGWTFNGCSFTSARDYNVHVEGTGTIGVGAGAGFGDMNGLSFNGCTFNGSYYSAPTRAHYRCSTQYTLSVDFCSCQFYANAYPSYAVAMSGGTANFFGGVSAIFPEATFLLEAAPALDVPAITVTGMESQTSQKFLVTDMGAAVGENDPIRSTVITGLLCSDINAPIATEMIYWDIGEQAALILNGCTISGDVNVASADAKVLVQGSFLRGSGAFTGNTDRVSGQWFENGTPVTRNPFLVDYASNALALAGGLVVGDIYRTGGAVMVVI